MRNKVLIIDIDTSRKDEMIIVAHGTREGNDISKVDDGFDVVSDMASLCEALCTLIHSAEHEGIKSSPESLRDCINHLEQGVMDASYFAHIST